MTGWKERKISTRNEKGRKGIQRKVESRIEKAERGGKEMGKGKKRVEKAWWLKGKRKKMDRRGERNR